MRNINKIVFYPLYWLLVAPIVFIVTMNVLTYPTALIAEGIWGSDQPLPVRVGISAVGLFGFVVGLVVVFWIWRRYRAFIATVPPLIGSQ